MATQAPPPPPRPKLPACILDAIDSAVHLGVFVNALCNANLDTARAHRSRFAPALPPRSRARTARTASPQSPSPSTLSSSSSSFSSSSASPASPASASVSTPNTPSPLPPASLPFACACRVCCPEPNDFRSIEPASISLHDYSVRLGTYMGSQAACFVVAGVLIGRLWVRHTHLFCHLAALKLMSTAAIIATKFLEDKVYKNDQFALVAGVSRDELNRLERVFLGLIDFDVFVSVDQFKQAQQHIDDSDKMVRMVGHTQGLTTTTTATATVAATMDDSSLSITTITTTSTTTTVTVTVSPVPPSSDEGHTCPASPQSLASVPATASSPALSPAPTTSTVLNTPASPSHHVTAKPPDPHATVASEY